MRETSIWDILQFVGIPFVLAALIIGGIGIWELIARKLLLKRMSAETQGTIISRVQAVHNIDYQQGYKAVPDTGTFNGKMVLDSQQSYKRDAGDFLWLEFEVIDYKTSEKVYYTVRTKKPYLNSENMTSLPIKYNPYDPDEEYVIDGFYSRSIPEMKVLGAAIIIAIETGIILYAHYD